MIWTHAAVHSLPVTLLDIVGAVFLWNVARAAKSRGIADHTVRATRLLAGWFTSLVFLNGFHVVTCVLEDARASFIANHVGESVAALFSVLPLIAFSYAFASPELQPRFEREGKVALAIFALVVLALSVDFTVRALCTDDDQLFYRVEVEHTEMLTNHFVAGLMLSGTVFFGYALACVVFVRQGIASSGRERVRAFAFATVVAAAVVAVVINRLEGARALPMGSYTAWTLLAMIGAVVAFMSHSEDLTSFSERIVGITLTIVLVALAGTGEITVRMCSDREDAVRKVRMASARDLWNEGRRAEAVESSGAMRTSLFGPSEARPTSLNAHSIEDVELDEDFTAADGTGVRFVYSYYALARTVDEVAARFAFGMLATTILCALCLRWLFEKSVLHPLRNLERADASSRAKSLFIAQLSHELRTPLTAVVGHARSLEQSVGHADQA
ncbi:MAG TPA: histidine kinase dimerization/phospho-acceptor domain-containing protein, partial [Myxococcota bacterium]